MRLKTIVLSLCLVTLAQNGAAQRSPGAAVPLVAGSRVRVKTPNMVTPLVANFLEQRGDTLVFIEDGRGRGIWTFGLAQIERLETSGGQDAYSKRSIGRSAAIGGGIGALAGLGFSAAFSPSDSTREYNRYLNAALGAGIGAGIGAFFGSRAKTERWVSVPLPRQFSIGPNGWRGFTISFGFR